MSRSYKKHMGGSYSGNSDKYSRSVYHQSKRRAHKQNCHELCKKYEVKQIFETIDDFPTDKGIFCRYCQGDKQQQKNHKNIPTSFHY